MQASPINGIECDRICGIQVKLDASGRVLSVIGVYLPYLDLGLEYYRECLVELERVIGEASLIGLLL